VRRKYRRMHPVGWPFLAATDFSMANESRLKGGCSQNWPPYKTHVLNISQWQARVLTPQSRVEV
jgi:hypothetical protein